MLDACAAPGNKTVQLAALMNGKGQVLACELNEKRVTRLQETVELAGALSILKESLFLSCVISNVCVCVRARVSLCVHVSVCVYTHSYISVSEREFVVYYVYIYVCFEYCCPLKKYRCESFAPGFLEAQF